MKTFLIALFGSLSLIAVVAFVSLIGGTILYWIWPVAVQAFPGLVASKTILAELSWWQAVCLTWLFAILIKSTQTNNNK